MVDRNPVAPRAGQVAEFVEQFRRATEHLLLALLDERRAGNDPIAAAVKAERERIAVLIDALLTKAEREETYAGKRPYANCGATHGVGSYDLEGLAESLRGTP